MPLLTDWLDMTSLLTGPKKSNTNKTQILGNREHRKSRFCFWGIREQGHFSKGTRDQVPPGRASKLGQCYTLNHCKPDLYDLFCQSSNFGSESVPFFSFSVNKGSSIAYLKSSFILSELGQRSKNNLDLW